MQINPLIGIVTRNDKNNLDRCCDSILQKMFSHPYNYTIINDGSHIPLMAGDVQHASTKHNSACYNNILRNAIENNHEDIFILNSDVEILDSGCFIKYIETARETNLGMLVYSLPDQKKAIINYSERIGITLNNNPSNSFIYLNLKLVKKVGFFDERYKSVLELADYAYRAYNKNALTPFGWFPDIIDSSKYIKQNKSEEKTPFLKSRLMHALSLFMYKYNVIPEKIAIQPLDSVKEQLKIIKNESNI